MNDLDAHEVGRQLNLSPNLVSWLNMPTRGLLDPELPNDANAIELFDKLEIPSRAWAEILSSRPDRVKHAPIYWLMRRAFTDVLHNMGTADGFEGWPAVPDDDDFRLRHVYIWALVASVPYVRRFHADRGIPDHTSWRALSTLGEAVEGSASMFGKSGILFSLWVAPLAFRGVHYLLGRLSFDIGGAPVTTGEVVDLSIHVPAGDRLDPAACDRSLVDALRLMHDHFPERSVSKLKCRSWLLDPQLVEYLPATSNILSFQRRFELAAHATIDVADHELLEYLFNFSHTGEIGDTVLDNLPKTSRLQRAYVQHLRRGRHWHARSGWIEFLQA